MSKNKGGMFLAGIIGALAGAVGGLLLAPQSGKETRKDIVKLASKISKNLKNEASETTKQIKDVFGKVTDDATAKYNEVKNSVAGKVAALKTAGEEIDSVKYGRVVDDVVEEFKSDLKATKTGASKIAEYLKKDWDKVKKALA